MPIKEEDKQYSKTEESSKVRLPFSRLFEEKNDFVCLWTMCHELSGSGDQVGYYLVLQGF